MESKLRQVRRFIVRCLDDTLQSEHVALARAAFGELAEWIASVVNEQQPLSTTFELVLDAAAKLCKEYGLEGPRFVPFLNLLILLPSCAL